MLTDRLMPYPAVELRSVAVRYRHPLAAKVYRRLGAATRAPAPQSEEAVARGPLARDEAMAAVEAVLFLAREPLLSRRIAQLAGIADGTRARTLIRQLNRYYDTGGTAFRIEEVAGGFQMLSRPKFGAWLRRLFRSPIDVQLSAPAMETLAVVAYRQPVLRADVEAIRGVQCGEILRQLMERDLVRIDGRAEELGRPFLYGTTKRFLQVFGLRHVDELPRADLLRPDNASRMAAASTTQNSVGESRIENIPGE